MSFSRWRGSRVRPSYSSDGHHLISLVSHRPIVNLIGNPAVYTPAQATFVPARSSFHHSNLHVLYVSGQGVHPFSECMLIALLKAYEPTWNFNHIRLTNLCCPPTLPRTKPPMETATSTLLIIRNLHDLAPRVQAVLREYCLQTVTAKSSFLVLINVPRRPRCTPSFIHAVQVKTLESIRTTFLLGFLPDEVRDDVTFRVMALAKTEEKIVVRKIVRWLKRHNKRIRYTGKVEHLDVRKSEIRKQCGTSENVSIQIVISSSACFRHY
ncbi:hypothetical protein RvY_02800-1 [Ramazzottius varieornatus]|uniref:Uncharacterized protein n=1 Tax=Ramazzottius varieornatus TaxID=947166 RepID=A0A1D1UKY6_RAMVA|nr:hypothetical protein RvY_02800-1 [Ramazzottius varieornatus]